MMRELVRSMNEVVFMNREPACGSRVKTIFILILLAAVPVSSGVIFGSSWFSWIGLALIAVALLWLAIEGWRALFLPWPKYRLVQVNTKPMLDEFLRLGWTLSGEQREPTDTEPREYLLEWLREGDPPTPDLSKLSGDAYGSSTHHH